ncbi:MAG: hypothetical protein Ct9H90mP2_01170 [Dehalococcoidia bacterium]|nr:MAG: hypothetical protein Ct9H90mP2_01170 [Dehalococcoidia bacterium]
MTGNFLYFNHPKLGKLRRETTQWILFMDSSWYHLRFASPGSIDEPFEKNRISNWSPVDQYMGGGRTCRYASFICKVF